MSNPLPHAPDMSPPLAPSLSDNDFALLVDELNHRIRNLLTMVEATVVLTDSTSVEEYRARLMARLSGLRGLHELIAQSDGRALGVAELIERTMRPYCTNGAPVLAAGPEV